MTETAQIRYRDNGNTLERFSPESEETVFAIPETVEHIAEEAFYKCRNLKKVILPSNLKVIPDNCFEECENLEEVFLPLGLEDIRFGAFCGRMPSATAIKLPLTAIK